MCSLHWICTCKGNSIDFHTIIISEVGISSVSWPTAYAVTLRNSRMTLATHKIHLNCVHIRVQYAYIQSVITTGKTTRLAILLVRLEKCPNLSSQSHVSMAAPDVSYRVDSGDRNETKMIHSRLHGTHPSANSRYIVSLDHIYDI
jgi:hypothetical protein